MKKILMVCFVFPPRFSGAAIQAMELAKSLADHQVASEFFVPNFVNRRKYYRTEEKGLTIHRVGVQGWLFPLAFLFFLLVKRKEFKIVHFHGFSNTHFMCVLIAKWLNMTIVQKMTKGKQTLEAICSGGALRRFRKYSAFMIDRYIAISSSLHDSLLTYGIDGQRVVYLPNGVDLDCFRPISCGGGSNKGSTEMFEKQTFTMLCVSSIDRRKNILMLLEVLKKVIDGSKDSGKTIRMIFAGPIREKDYASEIADFTKMNGLQEYVCLTGERAQEDIACLYHSADLFLFAGMNEGLSNAMLEAKASGLPIVAFRETGISDVVRDGRDGFLIPYGSVGDFVEKVLELMENDEMRLKFSREGVKDVEERFDIRKIASVYAKGIYSL